MIDMIKFACYLYLVCHEKPELMLRVSFTTSLCVESSAEKAFGTMPIATPFVNRLGKVLIETHTDCFAWAMIPNHVHLLMRTGLTPIATVMRRLLTGYAVGFNRRHRRHGHLFQNRYKSILCQQDPYLLELVRYIHLNPLRARLVPDYKGLKRFSYGGHCVLMGKFNNDWQNTEYILSLFGQKISEHGVYTANL